MNMIMSILNPQQKQKANNFLSTNKEQQAQQIADYCNQNGITKEQLQGLVNTFNK